MFIDETAVNTKMTRLRGRSRRGQRLRASAPFGRWGTQAFIAALRCDELTAPWVVDGAMNRAALFSPDGSRSRFCLFSYHIRSAWNRLSVIEFQDWVINRRVRLYEAQER